MNYKNEIVLFILNGKYVHLLSVYILSHFNIPFYISWEIAHKLFTILHYYNFNHLYENINSTQRIILKPFTRFTDSNFYLTILYYFYPTTIFNIYFNIVSTITIGYWSTILLFDMKDNDNTDEKIILFNSKKQLKNNKYIPTNCIPIINNPDTQFINITSTLNHIIPYILALHQLSLCKHELFNNHYLLYTILYAYYWLLFIFLPWYLITGDSIYNILDFKKSPKLFIKTILFLNIVLLSINYSNHILSTNMCSNINN